MWGDQPYIGSVSGLVAGFTRLVLVAVMLCGGGGLPLLDALTHTSGPETRTPHVETAAASLAHGEFCSLGSALPYTAYATGSPVELEVTILGYPEATPPVAPPRSPPVGLLPQPRAPPAFSA